MNETPNKKDGSRTADFGTALTQSEAGNHGSQQLAKLSAYLPELSACMSRHDIYRFQELASGIKKVLESLELTDLVKQLQHLHTKCVTAQDLVLNEIEIQELIKSLTSNTIGDANHR